MNTLAQYHRSRYIHFCKPLAIIIASLMFLGGCTNAIKTPAAAMAARERLTELQSDAALASKATVAIRAADLAVQAAEIPRKDKAESDHLIFMAERNVDIAWAEAQTRFLEDQREALSTQRDSERLASRTREADQANSAATLARADSDELRRQISELNAKVTERGLVITLGDMLFETGKSQLKGAATANLGKLSSFLNTYPDRTLQVEGHTDNVGSEENNLSLSQRRADSVRTFLLNQGIGANRISAYGKGENYPVSSNESISGRALNRRVEVIINTPTAAITP